MTLLWTAFRITEKYPWPKLSNNYENDYSFLMQLARFCFVISHLIYLRHNGGPRLPLLFTSHSYCHLEGHFLAEMAGQQIGLNGRETKLA